MALTGIAGRRDECLLTLKPYFFTTGYRPQIRRLHLFDDGAAEKRSFKIELAVAAWKNQGIESASKRKQHATKCFCKVLAPVSIRQSDRRNLMSGHIVLLVTNLSKPEDLSNEKTYRNQNGGFSVHGVIADFRWLHNQ